MKTHRITNMEKMTKPMILSRFLLTAIHYTDSSTRLMRESYTILSMYLCRVIPPIPGPNPGKNEMGMLPSKTFRIVMEAGKKICMDQIIVVTKRHTSLQEQKGYLF